MKRSESMPASASQRASQPSATSEASSAKPRSTTPGRIRSLATRRLVVRSAVAVRPGDRLVDHLGPARPAHQPGDAEQVDDADPEAVVDPVLRAAARARAVRDD